MQNRIFELFHKLPLLFFCCCCYLFLFFFFFFLNQPSNNHRFVLSKNLGTFPDSSHFLLLTCCQFPSAVIFISAMCLSSWAPFQQPAPKHHHLTSFNKTASYLFTYLYHCLKTQPSCYSQHDSFVFRFNIPSVKPTNGFSFLLV